MAEIAVMGIGLVGRAVARWDAQDAVAARHIGRQGVNRNPQRTGGRRFPELLRDFKALRCDFPPSSRRAGSDAISE
jgi:hypothetical protein